jgi:hypothetical protein
MSKPLAVLGLVAGLGWGGNARADGMMRFGLTFGVDRNAPEAHEVGPMVAIGARAGAFVAELDYAYLSFFDTTSIHRLGVAVRADVYRTDPRPCPQVTCTSSSALYLEAGAAERFGTWMIDPVNHIAQATPQPELHLGFGYELDNLVVPRHRNGWQIGLRFAFAPRAPAEGSACRGTGCMTIPGGSSGVDESALLEWMFFI